MRRFTFFSLCFFLSGLMMAACQRERSVHAGNDTYQPRPALTVQNKKPSDQLQGELVRVDLASRTIEIRVENGMVQTFKFDDNTMVSGLASQPLRYAGRRLVGKEGSELTVQWRDAYGAKTATNIE